MTSFKRLIEANNAAQLQDQLNRAVVDGNTAAEKSAMRQIVALLGAEKAQMMVEIARRAVAERDARNKVTESQLRIREFAASAKRIFAEDQLFAEVAAINSIGLRESMKFNMDPSKLGKAKATYPKTNLKRMADDWNERVGGWADEHKNMGCQLLKRDGANPLVVDAVNKEGMVSTLVVTQHDETHNGLTIDIYNQQAGGEHKYSEPAEHEGPWKFEEFDLGDTHSSDQRNRSTTSSGRDTVKHKGRRKDGQTLQDIMSSTRAK